MLLNYIKINNNLLYTNSLTFLFLLHTYFLLVLLYYLYIYLKINLVLIALLCLFYFHEINFYKIMMKRLTKIKNDIVLKLLS